MEYRQMGVAARETKIERGRRRGRRREREEEGMG